MIHVISVNFWSTNSKIAEFLDLIINLNHTLFLELKRGSQIPLKIMKLSLNHYITHVQYIKKTYTMDMGVS